MVEVAPQPADGLPGGELLQSAVGLAKLVCALGIAVEILFLQVGGIAETVVVAVVDDGALIAKIVGKEGGPAALGQSMAFHQMQGLQTSGVGHP